MMLELHWVIVLQGISFASGWFLRQYFYKLGIKYINKVVRNPPKEPTETDKLIMEAYRKEVAWYLQQPTRFAKPIDPAPDGPEDSSR